MTIECLDERNNTYTRMAINTIRPQILEEFSLFSRFFLNLDEETLAVFSGFVAHPFPDPLSLDTPYPDLVLLYREEINTDGRTKGKFRYANSVATLANSLTTTLLHSRER